MNETPKFKVGDMVTDSGCHHRARTGRIIDTWHLPNGRAMQTILNEGGQYVRSDNSLKRARREETMDTYVNGNKLVQVSKQPKFALGDRVTDTGVTGKVVAVVPEYHYNIELGDEQHSLVVQRAEVGLSFAKLTEEDAWVEAAQIITSKAYQYGFPLYDEERTDIRHVAYQSLGGNGINLNERTDAGKANKARVRSLLARAEKLAASN